MNNLEIFDRICADWNSKLNFLNDKPEENLFSTVKALWFKAAGYPVSVERSQTMSLPDLNEMQLVNLLELIQKRVENTPLAYITGLQNFIGIELLSDKRALIPRKETEILGNKAVELSKILSGSDKKIKIMDVCCGSGNLGIAVAHYNPNCIVYASDITDEAVELTQENINLLNLNQRVNVNQGDMMSAFENDEHYEDFDLIICNPPYISSNKVKKMDMEISLNEPIEAFDGGLLGINIIQRLIRTAPKFLKLKGWLIFEVGVGQGEFLIKLLERTKLFCQIESVLDDSGQIRVLLAQK